VRLPGAVRAVTAAGGVVYAGLSSGQLAAVDLGTGAVLSHVRTGGDVHDVAIEGDVVFALLANELQAYTALPDLELQGRVAPSSFQAEGITGRKRLFVGGGLAYVTSYPGFDTFDVADPRAMRRIGAARDLGPNSFKQIVANGSGLGIAAVGVNPRDDGTHNVYLYDVVDPSDTTAFITQFETPGVTRAVTIYNGIACAADGANGLQVVNYLAFDTMRVAPAITIETRPAPPIPAATPASATSWHSCLFPTAHRRGSGARRRETARSARPSAPSRRSSASRSIPPRSAPRSSRSSGLAATGSSIPATIP
jgi:hypothetical protein